MKSQLIACEPREIELVWQTKCSMMRMLMRFEGKIWASVLLGLIGISSAHATFNGGDDFSGTSIDSSKWNSQSYVANPSQFSEINGQLDYSAPTGNSGSTLPWAQTQSAYSGTAQNWSAQVDFSIQNLALSPSQIYFLNFKVYDSASGPTGNNSFQIGFGQSDTRQIYCSDPNIAGYQFTNTASTQVSLKLSYDASSTTINAYYDEDGALNGYNWTLLGSDNVSAWARGYYGFTTNSDDQFGLAIYGSSYSSLSNGHLTADNFAAFVVPEPSTNGLIIIGLIMVLLRVKNAGQMQHLRAICLQY